MRVFAAVCIASALVCAPSLSHAQWLRVGSGRSEAMAGTFVALTNDVWQFAGNPAAAATLHVPALGLASNQHYLLPELNRSTFAGGGRFNDVYALGVAATTMGFAGYREALAGITYATSVLKKVHLGARLNTQYVTIPEIGSAATVMLDAGVLVSVSKQLHFGAVAINANQARIDTLDPRALTTLYATGLQYKPSHTLMLTLDAVQEGRYPLSLRTGIEYLPVHALRIRLGAGTEPTVFTGGVGLLYQGFALDIATRYQAQLGITPTVSIHYSFDKNK